MLGMNAHPKEGDIYKIVKIDGYTFELRFGYYADFERETSEPVLLYPDLSEHKLYTNEGRQLVTAIQEPCVHYIGAGRRSGDECCCDCRYYIYPGEEIGICSYEENRADSDLREKHSKGTQKRRKSL